VREVISDAAEYMPMVSFPTARPRVMRVERTFWEKATAIHVFCLQGRFRSAERFARHWHDVVRLDEACTNQAESYFCRLRRAELGHHHHIAGPYLARYAREMAWREDHRRHSNGAQVQGVLKLVVSNPPSVDFCGYWQRSRKAA
jgi:hypothetical protein